MRRFKRKITSNLGDLFIDLNEEGHYSLVVSHAQYSPAVWYKNGYSVFGVLGNKESNYKQIMFLYNHNTKELTTQSWGTYSSGDYHSTANSIILPSGKILAANETNHNNTVSIKISDSANDISTFTQTKIFNTLSPAYPNIVMIESTGRIYIFMREFKEHNSITYSDDSGVTWSTHIRVSSLDSGKWAYPRNVYSKTKAIYLVVRRDDDGSGTALYSNVYGYSVDGTTFTNLAGTFSRDVSVSQISIAEMDANYLIGDYGFVSSTCADTDDIFYMFNKDKEVVKVTNGVPSLINTISSAEIPTISGNRTQFIKRSAGVYTIFANGVDNLGASVLIRIDTTDSFITYSVNKFRNFDISNPIVSHNYNDTLKSLLVARKKGVYGSGPVIDPDNSYSDIHIIRDI